MKNVVSLPAIVLTVSVVSHGLFLLAPMPESGAPESSLETESEGVDELSVVVLSEQDTAQNDDAQAAVPDGDAIAPPAAPQPPKPLQTTPAPPPQTSIVPNKPTPQPVPEMATSAPMATPEPEPAAADPEQAPLEDEPPAFADEAIEPAYGELVTPEPVGPLVGYNETFPHFEGAVGGCFGFTECRRVSGAGSYRSVARSLIDDLEAQGYGVDLRDDLEDTGRNVYELSPPNGDPIKYLLVFSDRDGSAIYVMSEEIMTLNELQSLQAQSQTVRHSG